MQPEEESMSFAEAIGRIILFPLAIVDSINTRRRKAREAEQAARVEEQRKRDAAEQARLDVIRSEEAARMAAERAATQRRESEVCKADADRREEARKSCLLLYHRHHSDIVESLPWDRFNEYLTRFMNDQLDAAIVEKRGQELRDMILSFFGTSSHSRSGSQSTLVEISKEFERRRSEVQQMPCDETAREAQLAHLAIEEARAIRKFHSA